MIRRLIGIVFACLIATLPAAAQNVQPSGSGGPCSAFGTSAGTCAQGNDSRIPAAGVTSALAATTACTSWTPTDQSGASLTFTAVSAQYCQIGNLVFAYGTLTYPSTADGTNAKISLPVPVPNQTYAALSSGPSGVAVAAVVKAIQNTSTASILGNTGGAETNLTLSLKTITFMLIYPAS